MCYDALCTLWNYMYLCFALESEKPWDRAWLCVWKPFHLVWYLKYSISFIKFRMSDATCNEFRCYMYNQTNGKYTWQNTLQLFWLFFTCNKVLNCGGNISRHTVFTYFQRIELNKFQRLIPGLILYQKNKMFQLFACSVLLNLLFLWNQIYMYSKNTH